MPTRVFLMCAVLLLSSSACSTGPMRSLWEDFRGVFESNRGGPALEVGLRQYELGSFPDAASNLQTALAHGLAREDRVKAHKYLAFIHCVSDRAAACRDEFRKALAIDSKLELTGAEAGHPTWGPVFRSVKAGR
jgi:Tfp pilus assembly protein PilF